LSGEEHSVVGFDSVVGLPLTPALSPRRGSRFVGFSESEFDLVFHVGVPPPDTAVSPLSLWERARVRVGFWLFKFVPKNQNLPTRFSGCPSDMRSLVFGSSLPIQRSGVETRFK
jgi:hypothetical protein